MVRVDRTAARQTSSSSAVAAATTSAEVLKTETEVLNELVQQDEEAQNVAIKRVSFPHCFTQRSGLVGLPTGGNRDPGVVLSARFYFFAHSPVLCCFASWAPFSPQEIVKQLSALKQQYHDDTATLTQAYSARRKMLMDALLFYSSPTAGSAGGGGAESSACRDTAESADDSAPVRKPRATKRDEKG
jgi:hypothetical protein